MAKYSVQVEILLTADEKSVTDHYVKAEQNQRYKNAEQPGTADTGETVTVFIKDITSTGGKVSQR